MVRKTNVPGDPSEGNAGDFRGIGGKAGYVGLGDLLNKGPGRIGGRKRVGQE